MAGHRRRSDKPLTRIARVDGRAAMCAARVAAAPTWTGRLGPALDHVRAGLVRLAKTDQRTADAAAEPIVRLLMQVGQDLDRDQRKASR